MSRDTERVFRDLEKYLSNKELNSEADFEKAVSEFRGYDCRFDNRDP